jgi:probable HAF family extracellular repeat protein
MALLVAVAALPATASGARSRDWSVRTFSAADGSNIRFSTIAEDGAAAGGKFLADGTPKALYFNGKRLNDLSSRLGVVSAITGLNDRHQAAGYASSNPSVRVVNLFGANPDPSIMPRAFFLSGRTLKRLSVPSAAFGINISGEVVGTFRAKDGLLHGFLWRPTLRKRRGTKTFIDLGVGDARAVNDPVVPRRKRGRRAARAASVQSLMTIVGGNSVWQLNTLTDAVKRRVLAPDIFLQSVSNTGLASGGRDLPDMSRLAMVYEVNRRVMRALNLPGGSSSGFAAGISRSTGLASGSFTSTTEQHGLLWGASGSIIGDANNLPGVSLPPGTLITNTPAVSDTGLLAGFATTPTGQQDGVVVAPTPFTKLPLLLKAWDAYVDQWGGDGPDVRQVKADVREAFDHWKANRQKLTCKSIKEAAIGLLGVTGSNYHEIFDSIYETGAARDQANRIASPALAIEMRSALAEFADEMSCPDFKKELGLAP